MMAGTADSPSIHLRQARLVTIAFQVKRQAADRPPAMRSVSQSAVGEVADELAASDEQHVQRCQLAT